VSTDPSRAAVHDLRNLLTAILGFADLIERRRRDDEWLVKTAGRIRDAALRARDATGRIGPSAPPAEAPAAPCADCPRVLVVEDDVVVRTLIREILELSRFEVHDVSDGRTAIQQLRAGVPSFDVLILDWHLPTGTGLEVLEALAQCERVPVVVGISGMEARPDLTGLDLPPVSAWLGKPFHTDDLVDAVRSAMAQGEDGRPPAHA
jgi:CheY-like chemotaxis protein